MHHSCGNAKKVTSGRPPRAAYDEAVGVLSAWEQPRGQSRKCNSLPENAVVSAYPVSIRATSVKLQWECAHGHRWEAEPGTILRGKWCPECASGLEERICRQFFEQLFRARFPKTRPKWLVNSIGNQMELDGYCQRLRLAFEHQGEQHYSLKSHFITSRRNLQRRRQDDRRKVQLCAQRGITVISVPEIPVRLGFDEVKAFIKKECKAKGVNVPRNFDKKTVNLKQAYSRFFDYANRLRDLKAIARKRGGRCLSDVYAGNNTKLRWECAKGHQWETTPYKVKEGGHWCPKCAAAERRLTIAEMKSLAKARGGRCLSRNYVNNHTKLQWECSKGHRWMAVPMVIRRGGWCPKCVGLTIAEMKSLAKARGGKCLSQNYVNIHTKLRWECSKGHRWMAVPQSIKNGTWCPKCAGNARQTISEMKLLAKEKGGKCLSQVYVNNRTKLQWECFKGHRWMARPDSHYVW